MTSQDFVKGLDLSGLTEIQATQVNQMVDTARTAADKGLIIETTDTDAETMVVPDPTAELEGATPSWWKRYIWKRNVFSGGALCYVWDDSLEEADDDFDKWVRVDASAEAALIAAENAETSAQLAEQVAESARSTAELASQEAGAAQASADLAQATADLAQATASSVVGSHIMAGMIMPFLGQTVFSKTEDQGWLELDGSTITASIFPSLASVLGSSGGVFTLPDWRGRAIIGAGVGNGLTSRTVKEVGGSESVTLTSSQFAHKHVTGKGEDNNKNAMHIYDPAGLHDIPASSTMWVKSDGARTISTITSGDMITSDAMAIGTTPAPHSNMMPFGVARWLIKT